MDKQISIQRMMKSLVEISSLNKVLLNQKNLEIFDLKLELDIYKNRIFSYYN